MGEWRGKEERTEERSREDGGKMEGKWREDGG